MRGIGLQLGLAGAASVPSTASYESPHRCNGGFGGFGGFASLCSGPTAKKQARRGGGEIRARLHLGLRNPSYIVPPPLLSWASIPLKRRKNHGALTCMATLGFEVSPATVVVLSTVLGLAALRIYVYFRMEYIIAAMLGRHVPRGGAQIVELNTRGGKNLYYYPADIAQVVAVGSTSNVQILESQASRAGVPIEITTKGPASLGVPSSSMDAVVSVFCLRDFQDKEVLNILREAVRVLKPGKPLIFVETVRAKNDLIGTLLNLLGTKRAENLLPYLEAVDLEEVDCEKVLSLVDPHLVGIAKKKLSVVSEPKKVVSETKKQVRKGFKK